MSRGGALIKARIAIALGRWLARFPDSTIVGLIGFCASVMRLMGAKPEVVRAANEVKIIFVEGKPGTTIVRRMLRDGDPKRLRMIVRGAFLK